MISQLNIFSEKLRNGFNKKVPGVILILIILSSCMQNQSHYADVILFNGKIYTMSAVQPNAMAIAIRAGKILAVGSDEEILAFKDTRTAIFDLHGAMATPGIIESHAHLMSLGYSKMELDLTDTHSYEQMVEMVRKAVEHTPPGTWIIGRGWHQSKWDSITAPIVEGFPTHAKLSAVSSENPVFLVHASGHVALANAQAMETAGIGRNSNFEDGGEIIKDESGLPTGIFNENAQSLIYQYIPKQNVASDQRAFELAMNECVSHGITGFHDAGEPSDKIALFKKNLEQGNFKMRLYVMLSGSDRHLLEEYYKNGPEIGLGGGFLTIRSIKLFSDGALGSRGAWLLEPYSDMPGEIGVATTPMDTIYSISRKALLHGFQVCTHAIGDRANREVLDQYEKVFNEYPEKAIDHRFRIEHAQHLTTKDIPRFAQLGVIASMQSIHMSSDRPWAIERLGLKRIQEGAYVWQSLLKSGAKIINGTDAPVEPVDPIPCFYAAVTRKTLKGLPPGGYEPEQKMTREQALRSYTIDAAYGAFEEELKGSLEPGKYADITVFDQDIMTCPEDQILKTRVVMTMVDGKIVYKRNISKINQ